VKTISNGCRGKSSRLAGGYSISEKYPPVYLCSPAARLGALRGHLIPQTNPYSESDPRHQNNLRVRTSIFFT